MKFQFPNFIKIMNKFYLLISLILISFISCKNEKSDSIINETESNKETTLLDGYEDGEYCAEVEYFYDKTGTNSTYTLKVEIVNNKLVKIYWPNGGWLDESHFIPPNINNGEANFESDQGVDYSIKIIGKSSDCNYSTNVIDENDLIQESEVKRFDGVEGTVIWDSNSCDYVVIYTDNNWYVIAQKYSGAYNLSEGDKVRGDLVTFGFEDVYCLNKDIEMRLYIDNYYAIKSSARDKIIDKCNLVEE